MLHGRMHRGSIEKDDADIAQTFRQARGWKLDAQAKGFDDIGGATFRRHAAVAVFGYAHTRTRDHQRRCGRNVEGSASVATRAASVDQGVAACTSNVERCCTV